MKNINIITWNLNGIRSAYNKGFVKWLNDYKPQIICFQEIRADIKQIEELDLGALQYHSFWNSSEKPGYAGTAILSYLKPKHVEFGLGVKEFDIEGRTIIAYFEDFTLINSYVPNGGNKHERLGFKIKYFEAITKKCINLKNDGHKVILCGDFNVAYKEIDLAQPEYNKKRTGFLPEERKWIDLLMENGFIDSFRYFYPKDAGKYTWWSFKSRKLNKDIGWRFDYIFVSDNTVNHMDRTDILSDVFYSDHCPMSLSLRKCGLWKDEYFIFKSE